MKIKRTERGWAGHFICGYRCRFHLNTLLEYNNIKVIISTIGMMFTENNEPEEIGCDRYYETKAFFGKKDGEFIQIDVSEQIDLRGDRAISNPYRDNEANEIHENAVQEMIEQMKGHELQLLNRRRLITMQKDDLGQILKFIRDNKIDHYVYIMLKTTF